MSDKYAEVILPLPLYSTFTYGICENDISKVKVGSRVIVPFGRKKFYTGIVSALTPIAPDGYDVKEILQVLDDEPILRHPQLRFWNWISEYYLCAIGDVYKAGVPAGLKIESETFVEIAPDYEFSDEDPLSERETLIYQLLDHEGKLTAAEIEKKSGLKRVEATLSKMLEHGVVAISEKLVERYRSRKETYVRINFDATDTDLFHQAFDNVKGAKKQEMLLLTLVQLSGAMRKGQLPVEITRDLLLERSGCSKAILKILVQKKLVTTYTKDINRLKYYGATAPELPSLSESQQKALKEIHHSFIDHDISLLHGVTSSGKTEIYIHLIDYVLQQGNQVLFLVPEIALTTQLTQRLQKVFGEKVIIYHSKFSDNERVDIWKDLLHSTQPRVILGARSSIFLPFQKLGLIIVDEEHETSYKQFDPAPRYNARDAATVLASMHGAKTLLGSATPAVETYYKALSGKYGIIRLSERYGGVELPEIRIIDMSKEQMRRSISGTFAEETARLAHDALEEDRQVIFFHNRRGFAPLARCRQCSYIPKCEQCDVSLTYHRRINRLVCHYCGNTYELPSICPACKEPSIEVVGYGTERIEDEVADLFPDTRITRMDLDTTRNKDSYENIISEFSAHKSDILVGTQMVTKGLDFAGVNLVGILNADTLINFPDFRSSERAFNMMMQVAGRAGRRNGGGIVAVQTYQPEHPLISHLQKHDYNSFYEMEIEDRKRYTYPPFSRLIYIYLKHRDEHTVDDIAVSYGYKLRELFGTRVYGPDEPAVSRIQSLYIRKLMLKIETGASMKKVKEILRSLFEQMHNLPQMKGVAVYYDVDPM